MPQGRTPDGQPGQEYERQGNQSQRIVKCENEFPEEPQTPNAGNPESAYSWQSVYQAAVLETDSRKLADKIDAANSILRQRLLELIPSEIAPSAARSQERLCVSDALLTLDMIRRIELTRPGSFTRSPSP
jgi:hypothetical protein